MNATWLFHIEVGAILVLLACLLGSIIRPGGRVGGWLGSWKAISAEGAALLAATAAVGGRYVWLLLDGAAMQTLPPIGGAWVTAFGVACAIYLGTKAANVKLVQS